VYGIKKLRELILELAVRGKLVAQDTSDEPASELLKRIQIEKNKLVVDGVIKKSAQAPSITENEKAFPLPHGWTWARMSSCSKQITDGEHLTPERTTDSSQIALVTAKNVRDGSMDYTSTDFVSCEVAKNAGVDASLK
jgi:type I restriction enzyme S subunit